MSDADTCGLLTDSERSRSASRAFRISLRSFGFGSARVAQPVQSRQYLREHGLRATTSTMLTRIDHVAISVVDFSAALTQYTHLLGFPPCAKSDQAAAGPRAALFALSNARILLLEATQLSADKLSALAFGCADADGCITQLRAQAVSVTALPESLLGRTVPKQRTAVWELARQHTRGLGLRIVDRPDARLPAADSFSPNSVEAIDHVVVRCAVAGMDQAVTFYGSTLGVRLALDRELAGTRMLFFRTGGVTLEVIADPQLAASADAVFYGLAFRVRDLEAAHLRLTAAGFAVTDLRPGRKAETAVFSLRSAQASIPTLFIRDATRDKP